ncbi:peptidoglycan-binding domain-containing protein [Streptacidiphilus melanogenes]|uniref:peptidoglycan-binding domain-containing protein n=1 Tax=Streptacidiphilus melanogenes TaxID=411235 RepID=UPI0005A6C31D|nr:peptidoglycan-binding domain-containing protein [Streptacidiphilus melanogenes]
MYKKLIGRGLVAATALALSTVALAGTAQASTSAPWLGYGHTTSGTGVWCVQHLVNDYLRLSGRPTIAEDSQWGPQTEGAVRGFQQAVYGNLQVDGIVGPQTGSKLMNEDWTDPYAGPNGQCLPYVPTAPNFPNG